MTTKRLTMKGLIVRIGWIARREFEKEVGGYFQAGKLKQQGDGGEGNRQRGGCLHRPFPGGKFGKMVVKLT